MLRMKVAEIGAKSGTSKAGKPFAFVQARCEVHVESFGQLQWDYVSVIVPDGVKLEIGSTYEVDGAFRKGKFDSLEFVPKTFKLIVAGK